MADYKEIAVFGPHDRMNYGDLLFPIMLDYALSKQAKTKIELYKYSIVKSNFQDNGAFKSNNYKSLIRDINNGEIKTIIVAGGESLKASWGRLYSFISPIYSYLYEKTPIATSRYIYPFLIRFLGGKYEFPFVVDKTFHSSTLKVIYNSVGGANKINKKLQERLEQSDYIALRDKSGYNFLKQEIQNDNIFNYPDSAILLSDVYPLNTLDKKYISIGLNPTDKYIFFQLSNYKYQNEIENTIEELNKILDYTNYKIVLCPIGIAKGHEDHKALQRVYKGLKNERNVFLVQNPHIKDIISLIAYSECYIGTSLHGIITSMSYGVRYIGLNPNQDKIIEYLHSWSGLNGKYVCDTFNFFENFSTIMQDPTLQNRILSSMKYQKKQYYESVEKIYQIIQDENTNGHCHI